MSLSLSILLVAISGCRPASCGYERLHVSCGNPCAQPVLMSSACGMAGVTYADPCGSFAIASTIDSMACGEVVQAAPAAADVAAADAAESLSSELGVGAVAAGTGGDDGLLSDTPAERSASVVARVAGSAAVVDWVPATAWVLRAVGSASQVAVSAVDRAAELEAGKVAAMVKEKVVAVATRTRSGHQRQRDRPQYQRLAEPKPGSEPGPAARSATATGSAAGSRPTARPRPEPTWWWWRKQRSRPGLRLVRGRRIGALAISRRRAK